MCTGVFVGPDSGVFVGFVVGAGVFVGPDLGVFVGSGTLRVAVGLFQPLKTWLAGHTNSIGRMGLQFQNQSAISSSIRFQGHVFRLGQ